MVSVVMTCYNHEDFLVEALNSLRDQKEVRPQIILVDDFSQDSSAEIAHKWIAEHPDVDISFIPHATNQGVVSSLNEALRIAQGKYICTFSADDKMATHRLKVQAEFLETAPNSVGAVYSDMKIMDRDGTITGKWGWGLPFRITSTNHDVTNELLRYNCFPSPSAMFRRKVFEALDYYDPQLDYEDYDFWLRMSDTFSILYLPGPVSFYRVLPESMSKSEDYLERLLSSLVMLLAKRIGHSEAATRVIRQRMLEICVESTIRGYRQTAISALERAESIRVDSRSRLTRWIMRRTRWPTLTKLGFFAWQKARDGFHLIRLTAQKGSAMGFHKSSDASRGAGRIT